MNFPDFAENVLKQIPDYISGLNYRFYLENMTQENNERILTLHIQDLNDSTNVAPLFYLDLLYNSYTEGTSLEDILIQIAKNYGHFLEHQYLMSKDELSDNNIVIYLLNTKRNQVYLQYIHHCELLDLSIVYNYSINQCVSEYIPVHKELKYIDNKEEFHSMALENTKRLLGIQHIELDDAKTDISDEASDVILPRRKGSITMVTNQINIHGAAILAIPEYMEETANFYDDDLIVIPSSIHEIGIIKYSELQLPIDKLREMVRDINKNDLDPAVVLSDNLYLYSRANKELTILE